jgi:hypothetical protein
MPRRAGRPAPGHRHTRAVPYCLSVWSTSCPEGGVDAIERAAIREEVNARNRETLPLPSRYDSRLRPTSYDRAAVRTARICSAVHWQDDGGKTDCRSDHGRTHRTHTVAIRHDDHTDCLPNGHLACGARPSRRRPACARPVARTASLRRSSSDDVQRVEATLNARALAG